MEHELVYEEACWIIGVVIFEGDDDGGIGSFRGGGGGGVDSGWIHTSDKCSRGGGKGGVIFEIEAS